MFCPFDPADADIQAPKKGNPAFAPFVVGFVRGFTLAPQPGLSNAALAEIIRKDFTRQGLGDPDA